MEPKPGGFAPRLGRKTRSAGSQRSDCPVRAFPGWHAPPAFVFCLISEFRFQCVPHSASGFGHFCYGNPAMWDRDGNQACDIADAHNLLEICFRRQCVVDKIVRIFFCILVVTLPGDGKSRISHRICQSYYGFVSHVLLHHKIVHTFMDNILFSRQQKRETPNLHGDAPGSEGLRRLFQASRHACSPHGPPGTRAADPLHMPWRGFHGKQMDLRNDIHSMISVPHARQRKSMNQGRQSMIFAHTLMQHRRARAPRAEVPGRPGLTGRAH